LDSRSMVKPELVWDDHITHVDGLINGPHTVFYVWRSIAGSRPQHPTHGGDHRRSASHRPDALFL